MHMPLHQQVRGDDSLIDSHRQQQQFEAGGSPSRGELAVKHKACRRTRIWDSPSDKHGTLLSNSLHQKACCGPQGADPLSEALSVPILWGTQGHHLYLHDKDHEPVNTNSYNSSALAG